LIPETGFIILLRRSASFAGDVPVGATFLFPNGLRAHFGADTESRYHGSCQCLGEKVKIRMGSKPNKEATQP